MTHKPVIFTAASLVFGICFYLLLLGNEVFKGKFANDPISWYFFAKGIFCSLSLVLTQELLETIRSLREK